jgi:hypothetical protein
MEAPPENGSHFPPIVVHFEGSTTKEYQTHKNTSAFRRAGLSK